MRKLALPVSPGARVLVLLVALAALTLPAMASAAPPPLTVTPDPVAVPKTTVGLSSGTIEVVLRNDGPEVAKVEGIWLSGEDAGEYALQGSNCGTLNEGEQCQAWFWFAPNSEGTKTAALSVAVYERPTQEITLKAEAVPAKLTWSPETEDYGLQSVNRGEERYLQLENTGEAPVSFNNLQIAGPDSGNFWTSDSSCWGLPSGMIEPGQSCWVQVYFQPYEMRPYEAELVANAGAFSFAAPLRGEGGRAELVPAANPFGFGAAGVGGPGAQRTITLTNEGNMPGAFFIAVIAGGDSGSFELLEEDCSGFEPVGPGETCTAQVRFQPQSPGAKTARLALFGEDDGGTMVMLEGEGVAAAVGLSAIDLAFGAQEAGTRSAARTLLVENDGVAAAAVDRVALVGRDPDQFVLAGDECSDATLAPGASCALRVRFAPDSAGAKTARLRVVGGFGTLSANLSGTGEEAAAATAAAPAGASAGPPAKRFARNATINGPKLSRKARHASRKQKSGKRLHKQRSGKHRRGGGRR